MRVGIGVTAVRYYCTTGFGVAKDEKRPVVAIAEGGDI
jgi:hypothetical protein